MTGEKNKTWPGDTWEHGGGATWNGGTYDPETNLIYFGIGNPAPWSPHLRPGDNLYTDSVLALNPENGEIVWYFQYTPNDSWDFDGASEFVAFDYQDGARTIKAGGEANRNGFFYVLDRTNGKFIRAFPFVSKILWATSIDEQGRPVEAGTRPGNPLEASEGQQASGGQPVASHVHAGSIFTAPSFLGAKNWSPMAYSLDTGLFYVPSNEWGHGYVERADHLQERGRFPWCRVHDQAAVSGSHRRAAGGQSEGGHDRLGIQEQSAAVEWRPGHQGRARVGRHAGRLSQGV